MERIYSEFVKELKLWGMCSLPASVETDFPNLEKLELTLYDDAEENYVNYILNLVKWIKETDIPEIRMNAVNMNVTQVDYFEELCKHGFSTIKVHAIKWVDTAGLKSLEIS